MVKPGEGKSGQNWPSFIRGDPVGSNMKLKLLKEINVNCSMLHIPFELFLCLGEFWCWEPSFGQGLNCFFFHCADTYDTN